MSVDVVYKMKVTIQCQFTTSVYHVYYLKVTIKNKRQMSSVSFDRKMIRPMIYMVGWVEPPCHILLLNIRPVKIIIFVLG